MHDFGGRQAVWYLRRVRAGEWPVHPILGSRASEFGVTHIDASSETNDTRIPRLFGIPDAIPSTARSYQALTLYPALAYGLDNDGIDAANFRIIGIGNRGLSGVVYRTKVARVCSNQGRRNAWSAWLGKIADAEFHARKIER